MPSTRLTTLTYTVAGLNEAELLTSARNRLTRFVDHPEHWTILITAEPGTNIIEREWIGTATATHTPTPPPNPLKATPPGPVKATPI